jgi:hypothetical protein
LVSCTEKNLATLFGGNVPPLREAENEEVFPSGNLVKAENGFLLFSNCFLVVAAEAAAVEVFCFFLKFLLFAEKFRFFLLSRKKLQQL